MTEFLNSETGWLNLTNTALGLAVLVCLLAVGRMVIQDLRRRSGVRARAAGKLDLRAFTLSSLGITLADGGEPIDEKAILAKRQVSLDDDPPNIIRSDN